MLISVACAIFLAASGPRFKAELTYTIEAFSADCLQSGGTPKLFQQSVVCEDNVQGSIHCERVEDIVRLCTLSAARQT